MIVIIPLDEFNALPLFSIIKGAVGIIMPAIAFGIIDAVVVNGNAVVRVDRIPNRHGMADDAQRITLAEEQEINGNNNKEKGEE